MTATIHRIHSEIPDGLPSLGEMCITIKRNYAVLDEVDRSFFALIHRVWQQGNKAKIGTVMECRSISWSMIGRYGLK